MSRFLVRVALAGAAALALIAAGGASARPDATTRAGALAASSDLFFSEYVEGTSNNKALELYNGTGAPVDLAAAGYKISMFFNGATTAGTNINLTGTVAAGDVFVLANASAAAPILAQADQTSSASFYNGDDAIELVKGTTVVDVIGQVGVDPGTEWGIGLTSTADNTLRRKPAITAGDTDPSNAFDPAVEWDGFPTDTFDGLGSHTVAGADAPPTVQSTTPTNGATGVAVDTSPTITFSEPVTAGSGAFGITCATSGAHTAVVSGGPTTFTLNPDSDFSAGESCTVTVTAAQIHDQDGTADAMASDFSFAFSTAAASTPAKVVISQVYGGGGNSGATLKNDFVELYNAGGTAVDVTGWTVQYSAAAATGTWSTTALSGTIQPNRYYLVQEGAGAGGTADLPSPDATGGINMSGTAGRILLSNGSAALTGECPAVRVDLVGYGTSTCFEGASAAPAPSNTTAALRKGGGCTDTDDNGADFTTSAPNPRNSATAPFICGTEPPPPPPTEAPIHDIQGAAHVSPLRGQTISTTGIVTARKSNGFYLQDPTPDSDPATSEAIFVFTSSAPTVNPGDSVRVSARVSEFRPGGATTQNLSTTELDAPTVTVLSSGNPLPATTLVGSGGRMPPLQLIEDDATGDVESSGVFDPATDGLDFWESLEAMRVQIDDAVAVGPTQTAFGETPIVSNSAASLRTPRGGVIARANDFNPERVILDDLLAASPSMNVGDHYTSPVVGVLDYNFGNFFLEVTQTPTVVHDGVTPESTTAQGPGQLSIATFNVENLDPGDGAAKFARLADIVVKNLKSPDIVGVEEVQDNDGATNSGNVDATVTLDTLVAAIQTAGGPTYSYRLVNPVNNQDGGEPGGNIRVVFLFRTDRGLAFVDAPGATPTTPNAVTPSGDLQYSPGRIDPANPAFNSSRKPLAGEFTFMGQKLFVITNHFNSKGGDDPLMGRRQPPVFASETQRHQQAHIVSDFVHAILTANPNGKVVALGDFNDYQFSETLTILKGTELHDMLETLPVEEQYSYDFEGNSETLDHILVSDGAFALPHQEDVVHVNSEFFDQASDHDPQVTRLTFNGGPTVSAGPDKSVDEGGSVSLTASGSDPDGDPLTYAWDLNNDGTYETAGQTVTYHAGDGPATATVGVKATDPSGASATDTAQITIANVAPTATFVAPDQVYQGDTYTIRLTNPNDPSAADAAALTYAFDCGTGYGAFSAASSRTCTAGAPGTVTVRGKVRDKDGGVTEYSHAVSVGSKYDKVCALVRQYSSSKPLADSICVALAIAEKQAGEGHKVVAKAVLVATEVLVRVGRLTGAFTPQEADALISAIRAL